MPRVYLTQSQRAEAEIERQKTSLADGVAYHKAKGRLTNAEVGNGLEIGGRTIGRILDGHDAQLTISQTLRLLRFAGFQLTRREP